MIKLQVIGHIGKNAQINEVNGKRVINFNVAHSEKYKDHNGNEINKAIWVSCAYWTDKTTVAQYLLTGTQVYIEGSANVKQYRKNDGSHGAALECRVQSIQLLGSKDKPEGGTSNGQKQQGHPSSMSADEITEPIDDLPF